MTVYVEYQNGNYTSINKGEQNHLKVTQKLSEQHTWKSRYQRTTKHSYTGTADILRNVLKQRYKKCLSVNIT
jgi:hypothetical protein